MWFWTEDTKTRTRVYILRRNRVDRQVVIANLTLSSTRWSPGLGKCVWVREWLTGLRYSWSWLWSIPELAWSWHQAHPWWRYLIVAIYTTLDYMVLYVAVSEWFGRLYLLDMKMIYKALSNSHWFPDALILGVMPQATGLLYSVELVGSLCAQSCSVHDSTAWPYPLPSPITIPRPIALFAGWSCYNQVSHTTIGSVTL